MHVIILECQFSTDLFWECTDACTTYSCLMCTLRGSLLWWAHEAFQHHTQGSSTCCCTVMMDFPLCMITHGTIFFKLTMNEEIFKCAGGSIPSSHLYHCCTLPMFSNMKYHIKMAFHSSIDNCTSAILSLLFTSLLILQPLSTEKT